MPKHLCAYAACESDTSIACVQVTIPGSGRPKFCSDLHAALYLLERVRRRCVENGYSLSAGIIADFQDEMGTGLEAVGLLNAAAKEAGR